MRKQPIGTALLALVLAGTLTLASCTGNEAPTSTESTRPSGSSASSSHAASLPESTASSAGDSLPQASSSVTPPDTSAGATTPGSSSGSTVSTVPAPSVIPSQSTVATIPGSTPAATVPSASTAIPTTRPVPQPTAGPTAGATVPAVTDDRIQYTYGGLECAAFQWQDRDPAHAKVGYRLSGSSQYTYIDAPLIRAKDSSTARADVVGLLGGKLYDFIIESSDGRTMTVKNLLIASYDRSGYAHFGYDQGVGAYEDSGQLKSGALVIYLTESNKNDVLSSAYVDGKAVDIRPYMKNGQVTGIGELLNNRRYAGTDRWDVGIAKLCQVYGSVTIRVIGKVAAQQNADGTSTIRGLTDYSSTGNGGSVGDNGRMARMVNAKNLTIEGIGEDAILDGWGIHFISNHENGSLPGAGKSFEVRNIRFQNYPEDAVGMEGQQSGNASGRLTSPVERCWIHHNSFYPGYCQNPAESDKKEGDGSCDFKRGRYYTLSYNYFVDCHKTNLVGSSDDSLQYDITFHHNFWDNCGSRMPLLRRANIHFYNNYIRMEQDREYGSTGTKLDHSYVTSARANSLMFAENNYYEGCKRVVEIKSGGAVKALGNIYDHCNYENQAVIVSGRTEKISNSCSFTALGIDYRSFDTDPTLFYYDAARQRSDCYLTDAITARQEVAKQAGTQNRPPVQLAPPSGGTDTPTDPVLPPVEPSNGAVVAIFTGLDPSLAADAGFYVENGNYKIGVSFSFDGTTYQKPLKLETQTVISFATTEEITLTLKIDGASKNIKIDGTKYKTDANGLLTVTLAAGSHTVTKGDSCNLCYIILDPFA